MSFRDVMTMPIRTFWSFANNAVRLQAEEDLRAMDVALSAQSGEFAKELRSRLNDVIVPPVKTEEPEIDHKAGIAKLKALLGQ